MRLTVTDLASGRVFRTFANAPREAGINRVQWNLRGDPPQGQAQGGGGGGGGGRGGGGGGQGPSAQVGVYRVTLAVGGREYTQNIRVLEDIWLDQR